MFNIEVQFFCFYVIAAGENPETDSLLTVRVSVKNTAVYF